MLEESFNTTTIHPLALVIMGISAIVILRVDKKHVLIPHIIVICFVSAAQRLVVAGLDFSIGRILLLITWTRILLKNEAWDFKVQPLDKLIIVFSLVRLILYTSLHKSAGALINQLGASFDTIGFYFVFRIYIKNLADVKAIVKYFAVISLPVFVFFAIERFTARNPFALFGGVPPITMVREGRLRCQGAFPHPIMAGCFWVGVLPMIIAQAWDKDRNKILVYASIICSLLIIFFSASSTPMLGVMVCAAGAFVYNFRDRLKEIRFALVAMIIGLELLMEAPVYHLIARIDLSGGSTGWHRFFLIDQAINRIGEWWLMGVASTDHWGRGLFDITNEYILVAVRSGLAGLILFVAIIVQAFRGVGIGVKMHEGRKSDTIFIWSIGLALLAHVTMFIGVSYFGQIGFLWNLTLAFTAVVSQGMEVPARANLRPLLNHRS